MSSFLPSEGGGRKRDKLLAAAKNLTAGGTKNEESSPKSEPAACVLFPSLVMLLLACSHVPPALAKLLPPIPAAVDFSEFSFFPSTRMFTDCPSSLRTPRCTMDSATTTLRVAAHTVINIAMSARSCQSCNSTEPRENTTHICKTSEDGRQVSLGVLSVRRLNISRFYTAEMF